MVAQFLSAKHEVGANQDWQGLRLDCIDHAERVALRRRARAFGAAGPLVG
jgi:hypothetical protein